MGYIKNKRLTEEELEQTANFGKFKNISDIRIDRLMDTLTEKDPSKFESLDKFSDDVWASLEPRFTAMKEEGLYPDCSHEVVESYLDMKLAYSIHNDFLTSAKMYTKNRYDDYKKIDEPKLRYGDITVDWMGTITPAISLHITHNDGDAYGCAAVTIMASCLRPNDDWRESASIGFSDMDIVVNATAGESNKYIVTTALLFTYYFDQAFPYRFIISDLNAYPSAIEAAITLLNPPILRPFTKLMKNEEFFSKKAMQFLYVDHHPTCEFIENREGNINDPYWNEDTYNDLQDFVVCATDIGGTITEEIRLYGNNLTCTASHPNVPILVPEIMNATCGKNPKYGIDYYEECMVSAAMILWSYFRNWFYKLRFYVPDDFPNRDSMVVRNAGAKTHIIYEIDRFIISISQWDTFAWRDCPVYNTGNEFNLVYAQAAMKNPDMLSYYLYEYWHLLAYNCEERVKLSASYTMYPKSLNDAVQIGKEFTDSETAYMLRNYRRVSLEEIVVYAGSFREEIADHAQGYQHPITNASDVVYKENGWLQSPTSLDAADGMDKIQKLGKTPETWFITFYPHNGNHSLVIHRFIEGMQEKGYDMDECGVISVTNGSPIVSFRTSSTTYVVNGIAKYYGGGGHPQAAGVRNGRLSTALKVLYERRIPDKK